MGQANGFYLLRCEICATLYTPDVAISDFSEEYEGYYTDDNLHYPAFVGTSLDRTFAGFAPYRRSGRMIDVGFGAASTMEAAARAGWDVEGVEVSKPAVEHAQELGFTVKHCELHEAGYPDGHFDVAISSEVLEHVADPRGLLREIARVLRPGGLLWATTPHGRGISARLLGLQWSVVVPPEHLQLFSRSAMYRMFDAADLRITAIRTEAVNPIELVRHYRPRRSSGRSARGGVEPEFDRVRSGYAILERMYSRPSLRMAKNGMNSMLSVARMGDSLKVWAEKES
ncbi:MAG: class I SAM-dependent methyltransferase [Acidimicrobiales bacterium]